MEDNGIQSGGLHGGFSCVSAQIPIEVVPLAGVGKEALRTRLTTEMHLTDIKELPEHDDKVLSAWLKLLNQKLEAVIGLLDKEREQFRRLEYRNVEISGGGITVRLPDEFENKGLVEMKLLLPAIPPVAMYVYGEVADCRGGAVSVRYLPMDDELRDRIVHYVFQRQREVLREQRENRGKDN